MGNNQIRVELAGVKAGDPVIADLHKVTGLPVTLTEKYSETVGGVLGGNDLHDTIVAGLVALTAIFSFLVLAYRGKGLIAAFTTSVSLWLLLSAFVLLHAPLSLSAIVAFVLAIGIASDANIIAFERSHEQFHTHCSKGGRDIVAKPPWARLAGGHDATMELSDAGPGLQFRVRFPVL